MIDKVALKKLSREGFLLLPMPPRQYEAALELADHFYGIPLSGRMSLSSAKGKDFLGYVPSEDEVRIHKLGLPTFLGTRKRGYSSYDFVGDPRVFAASGLKSINKWPRQKNFVHRATKVYRALRRYTNDIALEIESLLVSQFGTQLPAGCLESPTCSMMRLLMYEKCISTRVSKAHTDYEYLAILIADEGGLEVKLHNGTWKAVPKTKNNCVVLPGDMMAIASGKTIPATPHRVTFGDKKRLSIVCFQGLKYHTKIPYPGIRRSILFGEHICGMKVRGTPHLEEAWEAGKLRLTFDVPVHNPLAPANLNLS